MPLMDPPPLLAEQRRLLRAQMRLDRARDAAIKSSTAEALAHSRELLRIPVYRRPKLDGRG
jgi:hypothetical protein